MRMMRDFPFFSLVTRNRAEGKFLMGGGDAVHIKYLAIGGELPMKFGTIKGRNTFINLFRFIEGWFLILFILLIFVTLFLFFFLWWGNR